MKKQLNLFNVPYISSIQELVLRSAKEYGGKIALEDLTQTPINKLSFGELEEMILKFGAALSKLGLKERTHIAVIGENRVQWALSFLTCMCFNYVIVPIDKQLTRNEILNIIHESETEAIIFSDSFKTMLIESKPSLKKLKYLIGMDAVSDTSETLSMPSMIHNSVSMKREDLPKINPNEMAEIIFTSGSVGRAKGVMLTQKNIASNIMDMVSMIMIYPSDKFLSVLPMHHTYECTCGLLCPLYAGSSVHYAKSLKTVVEDIQIVKATILLGVPLLYDKMFKRIMKTIKEDKVKSILVPALMKITNLTSMIGIPGLKKKIFAEMHHKFGGAIRIFIAGGAAPDPLVAKGLREFGLMFIQGYGLTETSPILALNRLDDFKDDAAGIPLPHVEIKIVSPDSTGVGEIYAKAPSVMLGYYKNEKMTSEVIEDGWFKTGDLGYFDEDGFLHIAGRKKNVIVSKGGKNVYPEEIEDILNRSPFILECLVYGAKDPKQDEIIAAKIVVDAEAFIQYSEVKGIEINNDLIQKIIAGEIEEANKQLSSFKQIKKFYIQDREFEKTTTQKIKRYLVHNEE